ncbi:metalloregulator ArsR/SmtB family transcription factor [Bacillus gobiensis]|uniref:ArsR/SmtB family transcription factor n=1 Tax=Bacillus gobiensis TaxID=1441095 RepID=UPI003D1F15F0
MKRNDTCETYCYDEEKVNRIQEELETNDISSVAKMFKVIGDNNRAKIAFSLTKNEELCVCDVANIIGTSIATASHHLRTLHKHGIVKYRKEGKLVFYSLDDEHIRQLIVIALAHQQEAYSHV